MTDKKQPCKNNVDN